MEIKNKIKEFRYFTLYSNCIATLGNKKALIVDLQKNCYISITIDIYYLLMDFEQYSIEQVFKKHKNHKWAFEIMEYFFTEDIAHFYNNRVNFPQLNLTFNTPYLIHDCVIELSEFNNCNKEKIINSLALLGVQTLELISYENNEFKDFISWINLIPQTRVRNIEITCKYYSQSLEYFKNILKENQIIGRLLIFSCDVPKLLKYKDLKNNRLIFIKEQVSKLNCGNIHRNYFSPNMSHFLESLHHNSCLNKKISIDVNGEIKNCPSMKESFGNIKDTTLEEALNKSGFKKYWNIKKDDIAVCKACEFRHVCTDCRAYLENPDDIYSKPLKCGYNPYTNEWEEWSTNPLKQKAIEFYGMKDIVANKNSAS